MIDYVGQQFGNYHLRSKLGDGGFANVYLGEHIELGSRAAIKVLKQVLTGNEVDKFRKEARTLVNLRHPNIIRVLDFEVPQPLGSLPPFLVMEYASGGTLADLQGKISPLSQIMPFIKQIGDALQYVHDQGLVHLDIKPANILLGSGGEALLSDFGIAVALQGVGHPGNKELLGTVEYMAPERLRRNPCPASDQYSLAVVVYELLTGACPFDGTTIEIIQQHFNQQPPPLRSKVATILPEIEHVIDRALAKDPTKRFSTIKTFAHELERAFLSGTQPASSPQGVQPGTSPTLPTTPVDVSPVNYDRSTTLLQGTQISEDDRKDFFVLYNRADSSWAEWIAWILEAEGYSTILPAWDFRPGSNFEVEVEKAIMKARHIIEILSPDYLRAYSTQSRKSTLLRDKLQEVGKLIPIYVRQCDNEFMEMLESIVSINLVGKDERSARISMILGIRGDRIKPKHLPPFPGKIGYQSITENVSSYLMDHPYFPPVIKHIEIFFSYARPDEKHRNDLIKQLQTLKRAGLIITWCDQAIEAGQEYLEETIYHLKSAHIILLLISPDYMNSDYCYSNEMMQALKRHENGAAHVIPVILRPTDWQNTPFGRLQTLPRDGRPVTLWKNRDEAFLHIAKEIRNVVEQITFAL